jgi:uncharacterized protein YodC (DUF2158 family)
MNFFIVLTILFVVFARSEAVCDANKSEKSCMSSTEDSEKCSWCMSAAVGATCFKESDAKSLPSSIYNCEYQKVMTAETTCDANKSEKSCMAAEEGDVKCSWCKSAAVGATCFMETDAKTLPSSIYACEYQKLTTEGTSCDANKSENSCMSAKEGDVKCAWCKSAAVGSTCFMETDAKTLPSSIYACEYQKAYSLRG